MLSPTIYASGYRLEFQSASVAADQGDAAVIEDASTNWYNAAGLPLLPQQVIVSLFDVYHRVEFNGTARAPNIAFSSLPAYVASGTATSNTNILLPAIHYVLPIDHDWSIGLSVLSAWDLKEDFDEDSLVRYNGTRIHTKSIDVSPSVGWRINDNWSFGLGPDFHYFSILNDFAINTRAPGLIDSLSHFTGDEWTNGAHVGFLYQFNPCLRFGLNYRTRLIEHLSGHSNFDGKRAHLPPPANFNEDEKFKLRLVLPAVTTLSAYWGISPIWAVMASINFEQWSEDRAYYATNFALLTRSTNLSYAHGFTNTWDFGLGTHYTWNDRWIFKGSIKYLQTPTHTLNRDMLFPDGSKLSLQVGAHYQYNSHVGMDGVYGHVFIKTEGIHAVNPVTDATLSGHSRSHADFLGANFVWTIC